MPSAKILLNTSLSEEENDAKKQEMKSVMEELVSLSVEEKTQKLREFTLI